MSPCKRHGRPSVLTMASTETPTGTLLGGQMSSFGRTLFIQGSLRIDLTGESS